MPGGAWDITVVNTVRARPPALPVGPLALCASLERHGLLVQFMDHQTWEGPGLGEPARFASWLADSGPVLGLSVFSSSLPLVLASAPFLKATRPDRTLILGGPGTTGVEAALLDRFPEFDIVVHGEGDETLVEIMEARRTGRPLSEVAGLSHRDGGAIRATRRRAPTAALDRLPQPAYHVACLAPYQQARWRGFTPFGVVTARGCAYRCAFCAVPELRQGEVHTRDLDSVLDELRLLKQEHGVDSFRILDDTFTLDRRRVLAFCEKLTASGLDLPWLCLARVDLVDEPLLAAVRAAGCQLVFYGLESGSDRVLRRLGKGFDVARALDVVEMSRRHVEVEASFMWGFPFESMDDLYDTLVALLAVHEMGARTKLSWLIPFPATALVREYRSSLSRTLRHEAFPTRQHMDAYDFGPELLGIVRANRDIFSSFFFLDYPGHDAKMDFLRRVMGGTETDAAAVAGSHPPSTPRGTSIRAAGPLPAPVPGRSTRSVGGRHFVFDPDRLRAFHLSPFGERVFDACHRREELDTLVAELAVRHARSRAEVRDAVEQVLSRLDAEGLLGDAGAAAP